MTDCSNTPRPSCDEDIGICDDCGSEYEDSVMVRRAITIDGVTYAGFAWLCEPCGLLAKRAGVGGSHA